MLGSRSARVVRTIKRSLGAGASAALIACASADGAAAAQSSSLSLTRATAPQAIRSGAPQVAAAPQVVYVSLASAGQVVAYSGNGLTLIETIRGLAGPAGLAVDTAGNLYVAESAGKDVKVFAPGKTTPFRTLLAPRGSASYSGVAVDAHATVYAALATGTIHVYRAGATTPSAILSDPSIASASQIAVDNAGNVYAAVVCGSVPGVGVFLASSSIGFGFFQLLHLSYATSNGALPNPTDVAVDSRGDLLVTDDTPNAAALLPYQSASQVPVLRDSIANGGPWAYLTALSTSSAQLFIASGNAGGVLSEYASSTGALQARTALHTTAIAGLALAPSPAPGTW